MSVMKKFCLGLSFVLLMYFGGIGIQSSNTAYQGLGAVSVIVAFVILFALFRFIKTNMSAFSSFIVFGSITLFILYSLGYLKNIKSFNAGDTVAENAQSDGADNTTDASESEEQDGGFLAKLFSSKNSDAGFNPEDYPFEEGYADAITGSMLRLNNLRIKLLGIEAPYMQQTCANKFGQAYTCGQAARDWLQEWLQDKIVKCHIISPKNNGRATGVCFSEGYDIAAVIVNAGWAVAYTKNTDIYVPYEQQAGENKRGLWSGTFYKPWDWKKLQSRETKIKIDVPGSVTDKVESSLDSILGAF